MRKRILRTGIAFVLSVPALILLYGILAFVLSRIEVPGGSEGTDVRTYLRTNGVHTDLVLPIRTTTIDWSRRIRFSDTSGNDSLMTYVAIGWGDREFYLETPTWGDLKVSTAFKAISGLGEAAMHTEFYESVTPSASHVEISLSEEQYTRLVRYIENSFDTTANGEFVNIDTDATYGFHDAFYEARGSFTLINTCNEWTNRALKACGQKGCIWSPFEGGVFDRYRK